MSRTVESPGLVLAAGLAAAIAAAVAPAGLDGGPIPRASWAVWAAVAALALAGFIVAGVPVRRALRGMMWLLPAIALLALPAGLLAQPGRRLAVTLALGARALASASAAACLASVLGPAGIVRAARQLHLPAPLVEILATALSSLTVMARQVRAMLRSREARRPGRGVWPGLIRSPRQTVRGFGRLAAALLLRALERGEALERSRRARGAAEP